MPSIGEIKRGQEIGSKTGRHKHIWAACLDCGKERWEPLIKGKPQSLRCKNCSKRGNRNGSWKGGEFKNNQGYVFILQPEHPKALYNGYVKRSRLVLEKKLGRYLLDGYVPHHINGIKDDDRPENLMELKRSEHQILHNNIINNRRNFSGDTLVQSGYKR